MNAPTSVSVALGERSYDILVGPDLLADAARHLGPLIARPPVVVVTDRNVAGLHLPSPACQGSSTRSRRDNQFGVGQ